MTAGHAGLAAAEALAAGWLEERWYLDTDYLVKIIKVYSSAGIS